MALDFHIAKNQKEAPYKERSSFLESEVHELIFYGLAKPEEEYPLFNRIKDYYSDTQYKSGELEKLINEVKEIQTLFSKNTKVNEQLNSLLAACASAQKDGLNVWVYCD